MDTNFLKQFGKNVRDQRKRLRISQEDLATAVDISRVQVTNIETGKNGTNIYTLMAICAVLKCTPNDLLPIHYALPVEYPIYFNIY